MKTNIVTTLLAFFIISSVYSQSNLNDYKYIIVPRKFNFLKNENEYRLNELSQFLFNKYGFSAVMEGNEYPEDLLFNNCLALRSDVVKEPGLFKTKLKVELKDCQNRLVYTSELGQSREKEFKAAYNEALRNAFESLGALNYKYEPKEAEGIVASPSQKQKSETNEEIQRLKEEIQILKEENKKEDKKELIDQVEKPKSEPVKVKKRSTGFKKGATTMVLYAQEIENGFQLVDSSPKVVFRIKNTGLNNVFLVEGKSAIIYKKDGVWFLERYENKVLKPEVLNIKF